MYNNPSHMEPLFPKVSKPLVDRAMHIFKEGAVLGGLVHPITRTKIAELLRHINSYKEWREPDFKNKQGSDFE